MKAIRVPSGSFSSQHDWHLSSARLQLPVTPSALSIPEPADRHDWPPADTDSCRNTLPYSVPYQLSGHSFLSRSAVQSAHKSQPFLQEFLRLLTEFRIPAAHRCISPISFSKIKYILNGSIYLTRLYILYYIKLKNEKLFHMKQTLQSILTLARKKPSENSWRTHICLNCFLFHKEERQAA